MTTLAIFSSTALTSTGVVANGADVEVRLESSGALAAIWSNEAGTVPIANPAVAFTDSNGRFSFYAAGADRGYSVKVTKGADTFTLHNVAIGTAGQLDQSAIILQSSFTTKGDQMVATGAGVAVRKAAPANGYTRVANSAASDGWTDVPFQSKNLLINPNWQIDQINEGALYTISAAGPTVGPDGWSGSATGGGVFKLRTLADPDNAALKCLEITCTTADAAMAATDNYYIHTAVEGYDAAALKSGTAAPETITIQFKFKSNAVTGVFGVSVANSALNRSYVGTFTVAGTTEVEYTVTLTLDTTGTWLYTNGVGLYARICLACGSNFQTTTGTWAANNMFSTSSQANFMSVNTNVAYLKRIQLVSGSSPQAYTPADLQKELAKAQRYYEKTFSQGVVPAQAAGILTLGAITCYVPVGDTLARTNWTFATVKRAAPTIVTYNPTQANANWRNAGDTNDATFSATRIGDSRVVFAASAGTAGNDYYIGATANARLS
jgi:hypothetical protein